jgi:hypothetical protein
MLSSQGSGFDQAELALLPLPLDPQSPCIRQRRYPRLRLAWPLTAVTTNLRENCRMEIQIMNLGGGLAIAERHLAPGTSIALKINLGLRTSCPCCAVCSSIQRFGTCQGPQNRNGDRQNGPARCPAKGKT